MKAVIKVDYDKYIIPAGNEDLAVLVVALADGYLATSTGYGDETKFHRSSSLPAIEFYPDEAFQTEDEDYKAQLAKKGQEYSEANGKRYAAEAEIVRLKAELAELTPPEGEDE